MNLRDARPDELEAAAAVILAAYTQYAALMPPPVWEAYAGNITDVQSRADQATLILAEEDSRLLGAVTFYPDASYSAGEGWPEGYSAIRLLAVHPEARGRGLGRVLTEECIRRSRELGARFVGLHTTEFMAVAKGMYERMGFQRVPEFDFAPGPGVRVMAYRLAL